MRAVTLRKGSERRVLLGHLWVFSNEIADFDRSIPPGEDVTVRDFRGELLGSGTVLGLGLFGAGYPPFLLLILPPGAFITLGLLLALMNRLETSRQ